MRAILVARAPELLRTHLPVNSLSYSTFLEMRQAINQYLKARKGVKLKEKEDDPMDVDFVHKESPKDKGKGNDKGKGKSKGKSKGKGKHIEKGKSSGKGKSSQETFRGTCRNCGKTGHKWSECWERGGGAAKQVNSVGETEKTGDVNWIMMIQQLKDGQAITRGHETWRCCGTSVSWKKHTRISSCQSRRVRLQDSQFQCCRITSDTADHPHQLEISLLILDVLITVVRWSSQHSLS